MSCRGGLLPCLGPDSTTTHRRVRSRKIPGRLLGLQRVFKTNCIRLDQHSPICKRVKGKAQRMPGSSCHAHPPASDGWFVSPSPPPLTPPLQGGESECLRQHFPPLQRGGWGGRRGMNTRQEPRHGGGVVRARRTSLEASVPESRQARRGLHRNWPAQGYLDDDSSRPATDSSRDRREPSEGPDLPSRQLRLGDRGPSTSGQPDHEAAGPGGCAEARD